MVSSPPIERCPSCRTIGPPHGSDHDCIAALREHIATLHLRAQQPPQKNPR